MGWYGYGILDGDQPRDAMAFLGDALMGVAEYEALFRARQSAVLGDWDAQTLAGWRAVAPKFEGWMASLVYEPDKVVGVGLGPKYEGKSATIRDVMLMWQVAAVVLMATGAPMSDAVRAMALAAARSDRITVEQFEGWVQPEERLSALDEFIDAINAYEAGTPWFAPERR